MWILYSDGILTLEAAKVVRSGCIPANGHITPNPGGRVMPTLEMATSRLTDAWNA